VGSIDTLKKEEVGVMNEVVLCKIALGLKRYHLKLRYPVIPARARARKRRRRKPRRFCFISSRD
jgi:hypothetical protein